MKLIGNHASPFVRKARIVLSEKRIEYEFALADPNGADTPVPDFNPLGKIPVLVIDDGSAIYDSSVIAEYLDAVSPVGRLIPEIGRRRIQARRWEALCDGMQDAAVLMVVERRRPGHLQSQEWVERQARKVERALAVADHDLGERAWCVGDGFTLADIALGCALGYLDFRFADLDWRSMHPNLARHAEKLFKRSTFRSTTPQ